MLGVELPGRDAVEDRGVLEGVEPAGLVGAESPRLLDVGCSVGATLLAARQRGWEAVGVDVSRDAVDFCQSCIGREVRTTLG